MAMIKKVGTEYQTGMFKIDGQINQSGSKEAAGELRVYKNEDNETVSVYKVDAGSKKIQFEGLLQAGVDLPKKGDTISDDENDYYVEDAELLFKNDDAQKIRVTAMLYADLA